MHDDNIDAYPDQTNRAPKIVEARGLRLASGRLEQDPHTRQAKEDQRIPNKWQYMASQQPKPCAAVSQRHNYAP